MRSKTYGFTMKITWHLVPPIVLILAAAVGACSHANWRLDGLDPKRQSLTDGCTRVEGYHRFRTRLMKVVERRDSAALRALFHLKGSMRLNGIGGPMSSSDWGFDRPDADKVWETLNEIVRLGCARRGETLIIPAMAALAYDGLDDGHVVAMHNVALHSSPSAHAPMLRMARRGEVLNVTLHDVVTGWTELLDQNGAAFVPTSAVRSPHSTRMELSVEKGEWAIRKFGGGI